MKEIFFGLVIAAVCLFGLAQCAVLGDRWACHSRWSGSGYETRYGLIAGCQVKVGDRWLPADNVRSVP